MVGPAAALTYLTTSAAGPSAAAGDAALCQRYTPTLQQLYTRLRGAGDAEARRSGHGVVFSSAGPSGAAAQCGCWAAQCRALLLLLWTAG